MVIIKGFLASVVYNMFFPPLNATKSFILDRQRHWQFFQELTRYISFLGDINGCKYLQLLVCSTEGEW